MDDLTVQNHNITGSLLNAYYICQRKAWLMARQFHPDEDHSDVAIGRMIHQERYKRDRKEVWIDRLKIDIVREEQNHLVVVEVKKSSKMEKATLMQLAFYLYALKKMGIPASGEIRYPEERKKEVFLLTDALEVELNEKIKEIEQFIAQHALPYVEQKRICFTCAYVDFCWG